MRNYTEVEETLRSVVQELSRLIKQDGEDISCYRAGILDDLIMDLIKVRAAMTVLDSKENA